MTRIINQAINCPSCNHNFEILVEASINTWLDPELIQKLLDNRYFYACPSCNENIKLITDILINCPKQMIMISTGLDQPSLRKILLENEIITNEGKIIHPEPSEKPSNLHQVNLREGIFKEINSFVKDLLKEEEE